MSAAETSVVGQDFISLPKKELSNFIIFSGRKVDTTRDIC